MQQNHIRVDLKGLERLRAAATECAQLELDRITKTVIADLIHHPAHGTFGDLAPRHLWDEYCWNLQQGPFADDGQWDDLCLGTPLSAFEALVLAACATEVQRLPSHMLIFMSALAFDHEPDFTTEDPWSTLGVIWPDGVASLIVDRVNMAASRRCLDLIGPDRADCIQSEVAGAGVVWSLLDDCGEAWAIAAEYIDAFIDPKSDFEPLAEALLDGFMDCARRDTENSGISGFFDECEMDLRNLVLAEDVMTNLRAMRAAALRRLDR